MRLAKDEQWLDAQFLSFLYVQKKIYASIEFLPVFMVTRCTKRVSNLCLLGNLNARSLKSGSHCHILVVRVVQKDSKSKTHSLSLLPLGLFAPNDGCSPVSDLASRVKKQSYLNL